MSMAVNKSGNNADAGHADKAKSQSRRQPTNALRPANKAGAKVVKVGAYVAAKTAKVAKNVITNFATRTVVGLLGLALLSGCTAISVSQVMTFTIHGEEWTVLQQPALSDPEDDGETACSERIITLRSDLHGNALAKTLTHESLHALACDHGEAHDERFNNSNDEEDGYEGHAGIYWAGDELADFIAENPRFIEFVQNAYREGAASAPQGR
jgi:hypothetical protein